MIKVTIGDSHEIVREGIAQRIVCDCDATVVGQAADGYSVIKLLRSVDTDILIIDLGITRPSGLETIKKLRLIKPDLKILVLSSEANKSDAYVVLGLGAVGFMPKQAKGEHFANALKTIEMGYTFMPCDYFPDFVGLRRNVSRTGNIFGLSPRELEVLEACADGEKTKEIAERLSISVRTVETHRNAIYRKTDCHGVKELTTIMQSI